MTGRRQKWLLTGARFDKSGLCWVDVFAILVALMIALVWGLFWWDGYQHDQRIEQDAARSLELRKEGTPPLPKILDDEGSASTIE